MTPSAHCIALNFGPDGTALFVDGALAAKGAGTWPVPPNLAGLVFGSTWTGNASAEGDFDEIHVFGRPLSEAAMAWHYATHAGQAALGPMSEAEWQAQRDLAAKHLNRKRNHNEIIPMQSAQATSGTAKVT